MASLVPVGCEPAHGNAAPVPHLSLRVPTASTGESALSVIDNLATVVAELQSSIVALKIPPRHPFEVRADESGTSQVVETTQTVVGSLAFDEALDVIAASDLDLLAIAKQFVELALTLPNAVGAAYYLRGSNGNLALGPNRLCGIGGDRAAFQRGLEFACTQAVKTQKRQLFTQGDDRNLTTFCWPVRVSPQYADVLTVSMAVPFEELATFDTGSLSRLASQFELWHARHRCQRMESDLKSSAAIVELVGLVEQSSSVALACHTIVNELREFLGCDCVALALKRRTLAGCQLTTLSGLADFDRRSESAMAFQAAGDETAIRDSLAAWPALTSSPQTATLALRRLSEQRHIEAAVGLPLKSGRDLIGTLVLVGSRTALHESRVLHFLRTVAPVLGGALQIAQRVEGGVLSRSWRSLHRMSWMRKTLAVGAAAAMAGTLFVPWPYRVSGHCTLEPLVRRIVCAPYDGLLDESLIEPGDVVAADQIVARMDAREIRWELSTIVAERHQARKDCDRNLATGEITKAQLAQLEGDRLSQKSAMLESREWQHELRSPLDGIVLKGSVEKLSSAPVKIGQALFEIGQLNPLRLEIEIPSEDYANVQAGQPVEVTLEGVQDQSLTGQVLRVRPRSEIRDGRNVFVAEVILPNDDLQMRPGIRGTARITTESHPLGWNLFHKAWDALWRADPNSLVAENNAANRMAQPSQIARRPTRAVPQDEINQETAPTQIAIDPTLPVRTAEYPTDSILR